MLEIILASFFLLLLICFGTVASYLLICALIEERRNKNDE